MGNGRHSMGSPSRWTAVAVEGWAHWALCTCWTYTTGLCVLGNAASCTRTGSASPPLGAVEERRARSLTAASLALGRQTAP